MKKEMELIEEGVKYLYGTIQPGALEMPNESVVVCWNGNRDRENVLGFAKNFRREGNKIFAEIDIDPESKLGAPTEYKETAIDLLFDEETPMAYPGPFAQGVKRVDEKDYKSDITAGKIVCVDVFLRESYPMPKKER